ncbi:hypothetical protein [Paenibacillus ferrarius]|uniref:hypothetical protein n=1 Tax=Paenibacillus ferrarius TaxID=1469647 RepID=UPI001301BF43|nr:hypothetical protein [Paenibacillus ferrarius]
MSKRRVKKMATQIAATPIVTGKKAREIMKSIKNQPSEKSKKNGQALIDFFKSFETKGK